MAYCENFDTEEMAYYRAVCQGFTSAIEAHLPEWKAKLKIHLQLHLLDDMLMYGPTAAFNTEWYKAMDGPGGVL